MGRALLQALVGIMPFMQAQASLHLAKSQPVSVESWVPGRDMPTKMRTSGRDGGGAAQSAPAPGLDHSPFSAARFN